MPKNRNPWKFCNFDSKGVGFPRDCGRKDPAGGQWGTWANGKGQQDVCFYIDQASKPKWKRGLSKGPSSNDAFDLGVSTFNRYFQKSSNHIIKRVCKGCAVPYRVIYYKRLTKLRSFGPYEYFKSNWKSSDNKLNQDFALFSSYSDAVHNRNRWQFCNYDAAGIGFPRDCGKKHPTGGQWNSWVKGKGQQNIAFFIDVSRRSSS